MKDRTSPFEGKQQEPVSLGMGRSIRLAWNLGFIIAIPAVLLGFGGAYVDKEFGTSPVFLLIGFVLAALLSGIGVTRKVREILSAQ